MGSDSLSSIKRSFGILNIVPIEFRVPEICAGVQRILGGAFRPCQTLPASRDPLCPVLDGDQLLLCGGSVAVSRGTSPELGRECRDWSALAQPTGSHDVPPQLTDRSHRKSPPTPPGLRIWRFQDVPELIFAILFVSEQRSPQEESCDSVF